MGRLTKINEDACDLCKSWVLCKDKNCLSYEVYKKLAHYEDLEEQGRLIEVRLGHWRYKMDEDEIEYLECPLCGGIFYDGDNDTFDVPYNHCPNCGAKLAGLNGEKI